MMAPAMFVVRRTVVMALFAALISGCSFNCSTGGASGPAGLAGPLTSPPPEGRMPTSADVITRSTPTFYVAWRHPGMQQGEQIGGRLVAVDVGNVAPPGTEVVRVNFPVNQAGNAIGTFTFSAPNNGWPPGRYRVEGYRGATMFSALDFMIQ